MQRSIDVVPFSNKWFLKYQEFQNKRHFIGLDGLRCLAILGVLLYHSPRIESLPPLLNRGYLGVDLFFTLSGFLIVTLMLREKSRKGEICLRRFYFRKILRILPIYYGLLLVLSILYLLKFGDEDALTFFRTLPAYLTFTSNWTLADAPNLAVTWALATEVQFYVLWPLAEIFVAPPLKFISLTGFIILNQLTSLGFLDGFWDSIYGANFNRSLEILQTTFTPICFGIILAHLMHHPKTFNVIAKRLSGWWTSLSLLVVLIGLVAFSPPSIGMGGIPRLLVHIVIVVWLASLLVRDDTHVHKWLSYPLLIEIGVISYGIYLYHMFAFHIVRSVSSRLGITSFWEFSFIFLLGTLLSVAIAKASFEFYEKPILKLKRLLS